MNIKSILLLPGLIIGVIIVIPVVLYKFNSIFKEVPKDVEPDESFIDFIQSQVIKVIETLGEFLFYGKRIFSVLFYIYIYWLIFY